MSEAGPSDHIVIFDGHCKLCNRSINLIHRWDKRDRFKFAHLQSDIGEQLKSRFDLPDSVDSIIYLHKGKAYTHSTAALKIARRMSGLYPVLYIFFLIPRFLRDPIYKWIARNRYKWFGRHHTCVVPKPEIRGKFFSTYTA